MKQMKVNGIPVTVIQKEIQSINLYVKAPDGHVQISVPMHTSDRTIRSFVKTHIDWIYKQQAHMRIKYPVHEYITGETVQVFGVPFTLAVAETKDRKACGVQYQDGSLVLTAPLDSTLEKREELLRRWQREQLKTVVSGMLKHWTVLLHVQVNEWHIKRMKTKWGTCNYQARRIWLNLALVEQPKDCIEYVVVHELCHLLEPSHNDRFWGLMTQFLPDWEARRTCLNEKEVK